jgi:hypothetical protein
MNPYGVGLWQFLWSTVGPSRDIADWTPMLSLPPIMWVPFVLAAGFSLLMTLRAGARLDPAYKLIILLLLFGALRVSRLDAFFSIAMVMLIGPTVKNTGKGSVQTAKPSALSALSYRMAFAGVATLVLLAGSNAVMKAGECIHLVNTPEPAAVEFFKTLGRKGRVLTFFNWGEYAIWHVGPDMRVSMDGRRETVYSEDLVAAHIRFYANAPDAPAFANRLAPDFVWLPSDRAVTATLVKAGWQPVFRGPISTILSRGPAPVVVEQATYTAARCFPNP